MPAKTIRSPKSENSLEHKKLSIICPNCKSKNIIKRGLRQTKNRGKIQRYQCKDCKKRFVIDDGFFRMRNEPNKITACLDMYFRGISLRKLQEHLGVFYPHNASHMTILRWVRKYSNMIGDYTDNLKIKNSHAITFDEMEYKTKGKQSFFIDVMDMQTRYMISSGYYLNRGYKELLEVMRNAEKKTSKEVLSFYTDGLKVYPKVMRKAFSYKKHAKKFYHRIIASDSQVFNWKIERLHNSIRSRTKIMRQFKALHSAKSIMKGYEIFYNFCRKHQGINKYPYELATDLELGNNKWLDLIRLSKADAL
jgi:putative transposase